MVSISEAARFVQDYCLKDWDLNAISHEIVRAINNNSLIYTTDEKGDLVGICIASEDKNKRILHVKAIVAKGHLKDYIKYFKKTYSGYILTAYRRGNLKQIKL